MATVLAELSEPRQYLMAGQHSLRAGDHYGAARAFHQAAHLDPDLRAAYVGLARAFLEGGFTDNAIQHFGRAAHFGPLDAEDVRLFAKAMQCRDRHAWDLRHTKDVLGMPVLRYLGAGWEGANYLVRAPDGTRVVVKIFHPAFARLINYDGLGGIYRKPVVSARRDLRRLAARLDEGGHALYRFEPVEVDGWVVGIKYRYQYLLPIGWHGLKTQSMRRAMLAAFFRSQAYLLKTFALCLSDVWATRQFMLSMDGHPRYVDYGTTIIPVDDFRCREDHWEMMAAVELLFSVFEPEREALLSGMHAEQALRCAATLDPMVRRLRFVREILQRLEAGRWDAFLDADFYRYLGENLPPTAGFLPRLAGGANVLRQRVSGRMDLAPTLARALRSHTERFGQRVRRRVLSKCRQWEIALYAARIANRARLTLPEFVVIGARKCGTTWLYENLRAHPELFLVDGKGTEFFNKHFERGVRFYSGRFAPGTGKIKGEVCGAYSFMPRERIRAMHRLLPNARLVLLIRNPIERAWSQAHMNLVSQAGRTLDAVPEDEMRAFLSSDFVVRAGLYSAMLDHWLSIFPREQLYLGIFEDIAARPAELMREILRHIGASCAIDWARLPLHDTIIPPAGAQFARCDPGRGVTVTNYQSTDKKMPPHHREFLHRIYRREIETLLSRYALPVQGWLNH